MQHLDSIYRDLFILEDDIALDRLATQRQHLIEDRACIAQDILHAIRESGLLERLIAERSQPLSRFLMDDLRRVIETDSRIIPGSVSLAKIHDQIYLDAATEFGPIEHSFEVSL